MKTKKNISTVVAALLAVAILSFAATAQAAIIIPTVFVGDAGNANDTVDGDNTTGGDQFFGAVSYDYRIGTYEVTNDQYAAFLNATATTDSFGLYSASMSASMSASVLGGIKQTGGSGSYVYTVKTVGGGDTYEYGNLPVMFVSWYDGLRLSNWMTNGQGAGSTETGSYTITGGGVNSGTVTVPDHSTLAAGSTEMWVLPDNDEWYKAAYYDPNKSGGAGYYLYATGTDTQPTTGPLPDAGTNSVNAEIANPEPFLSAVGAYANTMSPYGIFDGTGNAREITEFTNGFANIYLRSGGWPDAFSSASLTSAYNQHDIPTDFEGGDVGFRLALLGEAAATPEPSTLLLGLLGTLGLMLTARRTRRRA